MDVTTSLWGGGGGFGYIAWKIDGDEYTYDPYIGQNKFLTIVSGYIKNKMCDFVDNWSKKHPETNMFQ